MRILVMHEISYFEGPVFEFQEFAESLASLGHEVMVLDLLEKSKKGAGENPVFNQVRQGRVSPVELRVFSPRIRILHNLLRPLGVIAHLLSLFYIFFTRRPEIVFSYSVPTSGPTMALIGKLFGVPVVHRCIDVSHLLRPGPYTPIVKFAETLTFRWSSAVSTHNKALKDYAIERGAKSDKVFIHYPPVDIEHFERMSDSQSHDEVRVIFVGTLFDSTGLVHVLRSVTQINPEARALKLRIVGDGPQMSVLQSEVQDLGIGSWVEFRGWLDYANLGKELSWADVAILPFEKNLLTDSALPQKAIQYMAAGLPVVSTALKGTVSELASFEGIWFVETPDQILAAALEAKELVATDKNKLIETFGNEKTAHDLSKFLVAVSTGLGSAKGKNES